MDRSDRRRFVLLCAATACHFLAMGMLLAALPLYVSRELGGSRAAVGLVVGAFSVPAIASRPWVGKIIDRRGRRPLLITGPALIGLSAVGLLGANAIWAVVVLRILQGAAGSTFYTSAAAVATDLAPVERRAAMLSRFSLFIYGGFATGPAVAEAIVAARGYAATWFTIAALAVAAAVVASRLPETLPAGEDRPLRTPFFHPKAVLPGTIILLAAVGYTSITTFSPIYAREIGMSSSGALYVSFAITVIAVRLVSGSLADRFGRIAVALPGMATSCAGLLLIGALRSPGPAMAGVALFGAGFAMTFPALMALTADRVPDRERGSALGSFTAFFDIGASAGSYGIGAIADRGGFGPAYVTPGVLCGVGAVVLGTVVAPGLRRADARDAQHTTESLPEPPGA